MELRFVSLGDLDPLPVGVARQGSLVPATPPAGTRSVLRPAPTVTGPWRCSTRASGVLFVPTSGIHRMLTSSVNRWDSLLLPEL